MSHKLIPQTGIQYIRDSWVLDDFDFDISIDYLNVYDEDSYSYRIDELKKINQLWYKTKDLIAFDLIDVTTLDAGQEELLTPVSIDDKKRLGGSITHLQRFEKKWIPIPMVKMNHMDAGYSIDKTVVPRLYFEIDSDNKLNMAFAVNTDLLKDFNPNETRKYKLGSDLLHVEQLFQSNENDDIHDHSWLPDYLGVLYSNNNPDRLADSEGAYLASYFLLLRLLNTVADHFTIKFERSLEEMSVNAFIDIGNTSTSVTLQELNEDPTSLVDFKKLKQLEIVEFSNPLNYCNKPFSTTSVFHKPSYISLNYELSKQDSFFWKSPLRLGVEAERFISQERINNAADFKPIGLSSPKRYLWDKSKRKQEWIFCLRRNGEQAQPVNWEGVTTRLSNDGVLPQLNSNIEVGGKSLYSRSSINSFVFLEIISQIHRQINSCEFRENHANDSYRRKLNNIVISCPTAMSKVEQVNLRKACVTALNLYHGSSNHSTQIIPSLEDVSCPITELNERKNWMYDESTISQILWLYDEVTHNFSGSLNGFKNAYNYKTKLRVASIDIGGGTSDLMVCDYSLTTNQGVIDATPMPVFWDSIYEAGDDLKRILLQNIAINDSLYKHGESLNVNNINSRITSFFDVNSADQTARTKAVRMAFINQIGKVLVSKYLEDANSDEVRTYSYIDLFNEGDVDKQLINSFEQHFGFHIEDVTWTSNPNVINRHITSFFKKQLKIHASLIDKSQADIVVLTGGTFRIDSLHKLFVKSCGLSINRIFNLNNMEISDWYPDSYDGQLKSSKNVVSVGSAVAFYAEKKQLQGFRLNSDYLKSEITSKSYNLYNNLDDTTELLNSKTHHASFVVNEIPSKLYTSPISSINYSRKDSYSINFDQISIEASLSQSNPNASTSEINDLVHNKIASLRQNSPFKLVIRREAEEDIEKINIDEIYVGERFDEDVNPGFLRISCETLPDEDFWLDSGFKF